MKSKNAKAEEIAGKLYKISLDAESDPVEKVFAILQLSQEAPLQDTLEIYRRIKAKWLTLAEITTAKPLTQEQKEKVEAFIKESLGDKLCFLYDVDPKILGGIKVRVGDNVFDKSIMARIRDLSLEEGL